MEAHKLSVFKVRSKATVETDRICTAFGECNEAKNCTSLQNYSFTIVQAFNFTIVTYCFQGDAG